MMQRDGFTLVIALLVLVAGTLFAHGEELYLFLFGIAVADLAVLALASLSEEHRRLRTRSGLMALAVAITFWFVLSQYYPAKAEASGLRPFLEGLIPSLALGGALVWLYHNWER
jgi:Kef-type K+ transport system membrane component KefB